MQQHGIGRFIDSESASGEQKESTGRAPQRGSMIGKGQRIVAAERQAERA